MHAATPACIPKKKKGRGEGGFDLNRSFVCFSIYPDQMGIPLSILGKLGLPGVNSLSTKEVYEKYFSKNKIKNFSEFHASFIDLCKDFNEIMPGKHYSLPPFDAIKKIYEDWKASEDDSTKKKIIISFLKNDVKECEVNDNMMIMTGMVAPSTGIILKKTIENMPQVKKFKLHLVPNFLFVPGWTLFALTGVRVLQINKTSKS